LPLCKWENEYVREIREKRKEASIEGKDYDMQSSNETVFGLTRYLDLKLAIMQIVFTANQFTYL
jgi:hypothetical protein